MNAITPTVSTGSLPASRKIHVKGAMHPDVRVPMRQIDLHPTSGEQPVTVYDSSGPYTDPQAQIDISKGIERHRDAWLAKATNLEQYEGRRAKPEDRAKFMKKLND